MDQTVETVDKEARHTSEPVQQTELTTFSKNGGKDLPLVNLPNVHPRILLALTANLAYGLFSLINTFKVVGNKSSLKIGRTTVKWSISRN